MGWDSDNPAATWGGLLGFMYGDKLIRSSFEQPMSELFNIHRTRRGFANNGIFTFEQLAQQGLMVVDRVVEQQLKGQVTDKQWIIPLPIKSSAQ